MASISVSSASISNAMRYSQMRMQSDLVNAQKEMDTGQVADVGLALGNNTSQSVTFSRDIDRLNGIVDSNALVSSRLTSTQDALSQLTSAAQSLLSTMTTAVSGDMSGDLVANTGSSTLSSMTAVLNSSINGEYLFAGTNTDVKPISDFSDPSSPARTALNAAFQSYFGFAQTDPQAANITAAQMDDFMTTEVEPQFFGSGWQANWSSATDQTITSRIALNETSQTSVSANIDGVKKLAMAAAVTATFYSSTMSADAKKAVAQRALSLAGDAVSDIGQTQSQTGIVQQRVSDATDRMNTQVGLFKTHITDLIGVDSYEAANRVNDLVTHIQTSYALTARIQQLSLVNFLSPTS